MVTIVIDTRALCHLTIFLCQTSSSSFCFLVADGYYNIVMGRAVSHWNYHIIINTCFGHIGTFTVNPFCPWTLLFTNTCFCFWAANRSITWQKLIFIFVPLSGLKKRNLLGKDYGNLSGVVAKALVCGSEDPGSIPADVLRIRFLSWSGQGYLTLDLDKFKLNDFVSAWFMANRVPRRSLEVSWNLDWPWRSLKKKEEKEKTKRALKRLRLPFLLQLLLEG